MKKFLLVTALILAVIFNCSCKNAINLNMYLSEIRYAVYSYSCQDYTLSVYAEKKESPYLSDGYVGEMKNYLTVKIEDYMSSLNDASVTVFYGEREYFGRFEYSPLNGKFLTELEVDKLPTSNSLKVTVKNAGEETSVDAIKITKNGVISYETALDRVSYEKSDKINKMLSGNGSSIESRVRVITENESVYYYVSVTDAKSNTIAYLVDGENGEILAEKEF